MFILFRRNFARLFTFFFQIPVYLSQTLSKELYVFQYPLRSAKDGWEEASVLNSRIKPVHQEVKLEFGLDTDSDRYSSSKGEQIALNTDGSKVRGLKSQLSIYKLFDDWKISR